MSNSSVFASICEPYSVGPFDGSFLTVCFVDLLFPVINLCVLISFGVSRIWVIYGYPVRQTSHSIYQKVTLVLSFLGILLPLINLIYNGASSDSPPWFSYIQLIFQCLNWLISTLFVIIEFRKGLKNEWQAITFWVGVAVLNVFRIQAYVSEEFRKDQLVFVIIETIIPVLLSINAFLFNTSSKTKEERMAERNGSMHPIDIEDGYSEEEETIIKDDDYKHLNSDENSVYGSILGNDPNSKFHYYDQQGDQTTILSRILSFYSYTLFGWMDPCLKKGYYSPLTIEDLPPVLDEDKCRLAEENFAQFWNQEVENSPQQPSLFKAIIKSQKKAIFASGILFVINAGLTFVPSILLLQIFAFLDDPSRPLWHGILLSLGLLVSKALEGLFTQHSYFIMEKAALRIEQSLSSLIYRKILKKRVNMNDDETVGEIMNLQAVDAEVMKEFVNLFNDAWCIPIQIFGALIGVGLLLGTAVFGAIITLILIMPISAFFWYNDFLLEKEIMEIKDSRLTQLNEVIQGIQIIKFFTWEKKFIETIDGIRQRELWSILKLLICQGSSMVFWGSMQFFLAFSIFLIYTARGQVLTTDLAFTTISLLNIMLLPLIILPYFIGLYISGSVAAVRIVKFLISEEIDTTDVTRYLSNIQTLTGVRINNSTMSWDGVNTVLENINLVAEGSLVAVVGEVGAGKSSLLCGILGETVKMSGDIIVTGSVAYVNQQGWLINDTLKNNILFGKDYDKKKYQHTLKIGELLKDIEMLPAGDETEIGERGINLSGGQKLRVSLARAIYADADVYLFDDPLSALDAHVGKNIFEKCLCKYLAKKTRFLVTHQLQHLSKCDQIILLENKVISEIGTFQELSQNEKESKIINLINKHTNTETDDHGEKGLLNQSDELRFTGGGSQDRKKSLGSSIRADARDIEDEASRDKDGKLMSIEGKESGGVKLTLLWNYIIAVGVIPFLMILFFFLVKAALDGGVSIWLTYWTNAMTNFTVHNVTTDNDYDSWYYLGVYAGLGFSVSVLQFFLNMGLLLTLTNGSKNLHKTMLDSIMHQAMSFFDTTPTGRILNRFGSDQKRVDIDLCWNTSNMFRQSSQILVVIFMIGFVNPIFLIMLLPLSFFYKNIQSKFRSSMRELQRLKGITRSPVLSLFQESFNGLPIIRSYRRETDFQNKNISNIDLHNVPEFSTKAAEKWFSIRLDFIGALVVFFSTFFSLVIFRNSTDSGFVGLSITYALTISSELSWLTRNLSEFESNFISVERIMQYTQLITEAPPLLPHRPPLGWPNKGHIDLNNIKMRYRQGLPLVLDDVSLEILPGHKVGICGRTGAGKSSLMLALFRMIELEEGSIVIDGEDIAKMGLADLRKNLSIIPQNPTLFTGTIRYNIDPFNEYSEKEIWAALSSTNLTSQIQSMEGKLDAKVTEYGNNLSVGTKQLLCLSRALLRKSKILIMDEATANVDYETDHFIQQAIQECFQSSTVLTIAHRINTIINYDRVLVLQQGKVVEYQSPSYLIEDPSSIFYSLAKESGVI